MMKNMNISFKAMIVMIVTLICIFPRTTVNAYVPECIEYPDYEITPSFNIANEINYDTNPNSVYDREVFKTIVGGNYNQKIKEEYYEDSIRYFRFINDSAVYDKKEGKMIAFGEHVFAPSIVVEDRAKIFSTDELVFMYLNYDKISIYTFKDKKEFNEIRKRLEKVEDECNFDKIILYDESKKELCSYYNGELQDKIHCEPNEVIKHLNDIVNNLEEKDRMWYIHFNLAMCISLLLLVIIFSL